MAKSRPKITKLTPENFDPSAAIVMALSKDTADAAPSEIIQRALFAWVISPNDTRLRSHWAASSALNLAKINSSSHFELNFSLPHPQVAGVGRPIDLIDILDYRYSTDLIRYRCSYVYYVMKCFHFMSECENSANWRLKAGLELIHDLTKDHKVSTFYNTKFNKGHSHNLISRSSSRTIWKLHRQSCAFVYAASLLWRGSYTFLECILSSPHEFVFDYEEIRQWFKMTAAVENEILSRFFNPFDGINNIASEAMPASNIPKSDLPDHVRSWLWQQVQSRYIREGLSRA